MTDWNQVDEVTAPITAPMGAFIGWAAGPGQVVIGRVLAYDPVGGVDYNKGSCPQLSLELIEPAQSYKKSGQVTHLPAGELCNITCGAVNLKANIRAADPHPGDLVRIELTDIVQASMGTVKKFSVKIIRGAGGSAPTPAPQPVSVAQQPAATQVPTAVPQPAPVAQQPAAQPQTAVTDPAPANFDQETWDRFDANTKASIRRMQGA